VRYIDILRYINLIIVSWRHRSEWGPHQRDCYCQYNFTYSKQTSAFLDRFSN